MITTPSLSTLNTDIQSDISTRISGATPQLRRSILGAIARALAGALYALYGFLRTESLRSTPYTAPYDDLVGWASMWGLAPKPATAATGSITATGSAGATIATGTMLQSNDGQTYAVDAGVTIPAGGSISFSVTAQTVGADGNQAAGLALSWVSTPSGVDATATVDANGLGGGADVEDVDSLRERLIELLSNPPQGGSKDDYEKWARSVSGVSRAWCFPLYNGLGTVRVYVADDSYSGATLAAAATVDAVQTYINGVKPVGVAYLVGATVTNGFEAVAPTKQAFTINCTPIPDTTDIRAAIASNIDALFLRAVPEGSISLHQIEKAILDAPGVTDFDLVAPTTIQTATAGNILVLDELQFSGEAYSG